MNSNYFEPYVKDLIIKFNKRHSRSPKHRSSHRSFFLDGGEFEKKSDQVKGNSNQQLKK